MNPTIFCVFFVLLIFVQIVQSTENNANKLGDVMRNHTKTTHNSTKNQNEEENLLKQETHKLLSECGVETDDNYDNDYNPRRDSNKKRRGNSYDERRKHSNKRYNNREESDEDDSSYHNNKRYNNRNRYSNYGNDDDDDDNNSNNSNNRYGNRRNKNKSSKRYGSNNKRYNENDNREEADSNESNQSSNGYNNNRNNYNNNNNNKNNNDMRRNNRTSSSSNSGYYYTGYNNNGYSNNHNGYNNNNNDCRDENRGYYGGNGRNEWGASGNTDGYGYDNRNYGYNNGYGNNGNVRRGVSGPGYSRTFDINLRAKRSRNDDDSQCVSQCVFGYLEVLDDNRVPSETLVIKWLQDHLSNDLKRIKALREARRCFARLSTSDMDDGCEFSQALSKCLNLELEDKAM